MIFGQLVDWLGNQFSYLHLNITDHDSIAYKTFSKRFKDWSKIGPETSAYAKTLNSPGCQLLDGFTTVRSFSQSKLSVVSVIWCHLSALNLIVTFRMKVWPVLQCNAVIFGIVQQACPLHVTLRLNFNLLNVTCF